MAPLGYPQVSLRGLTPRPHVPQELRREVMTVPGGLAVEQLSGGIGILLGMEKLTNWTALPSSLSILPPLPPNAREGRKTPTEGRWGSQTLVPAICPYTLFQCFAP